LQQQQQQQQPTMPVQEVHVDDDDFIIDVTCANVVNIRGEEEEIKRMQMGVLFYSSLINFLKLLFNIYFQADSSSRRSQPTM